MQIVDLGYNNLIFFYLLVINPQVNALIKQGLILKLT